MEKALSIAKHGDPMKFLIFNGQRQHLGDIPCQKVLILAICSANSLSSSGIQRDLQVKADQERMTR